jgi:hypothetical protein
MLQIHPPGPHNHYGQNDFGPQVLTEETSPALGANDSLIGQIVTSLIGHLVNQPTRAELADKDLRALRVLGVPERIIA